MGYRWDLPAYVEHLAPRLGELSLVICLDSGCANYDQLWSTTSLRGLVLGNLEVSLLREGVHSGDATGVVAASERVVRILLDRLEDSSTGAIKLPELTAQIPKQRELQAKRAAAVLGDQVFSTFPLQDGVEPLTRNHVELILNRTWRAGLALTGADGWPAIGNAGNDPSASSFAQCAVCHGPTGDGTALGYEIRHPVRPYTAWVVRHGRTGGEFPGSAMLAYATAALSDAHLSSIFDYLDSFPQPTDGQGLYLDYYRNCHGTNARGGVTGVDISDKAYNDALEKVREGEGGTNYANRAIYMPAFPASRLSDADVRAIAEYIGTL
ncbi:MAG TPA: c-type cytochrome [Polyangiaceae bacterium]|nr:c-type cytochrome [Polyangiaceae bacterium]